MTNNQEFDSPEERQSSPWGLIGVLALVGAATAALLLVSRKKRDGHCWTMDDLMSAADKTADRLEKALLGDQARAS